MSGRADAHLHFFKPGYVAQLPESCRRLQPDEITLYEAFTAQHNIQQALVVGYEGQSWAAGNNQYLASLATSRSWLRPVAYIAEPDLLDIAALERLQQERFVGLSCYVFDEQYIVRLGQTSSDVWDWLSQHHWLVSINARGESWRAWVPILEQYPDLRLLLSHLGLPPAVARAPTSFDAQVGLEPVIAMARFPGVRVKLSSFYAATEPGYSYPHQAAWPYVEALIAAFGVDRLLWGSDFSPSLEWLSFPQTFGLFQEMPFLNGNDIDRIEGENLLALLDEIVVW